jgi:flagellar hook-associated protein 1 FlgK
VQAQTSVSNAAQDNLQSIEGVNTNDEMVQMLTYQNAYQASAKLISTVDTMMQALIEAS